VHRHTYLSMYTLHITYVCMYVRMYVCTYIHTYIRMYMHAPVADQILICMYICTYVRMYAHHTCIIMILQVSNSTSEHHKTNKTPQVYVYRIILFIVQYSGYTNLRDPLHCINVLYVHIIFHTAKVI